MKKLTALAVIAVFVLTSVVLPCDRVWAEPWEPQATIDTSWFDFRNVKKTYKIRTEAQLAGLASLVNEEQPFWKPNHIEDFEGVEFILEKDIKLYRRWTPIGSGSVTTFKGTFNGNGHKITNLIVYPEYNYVGLFGNLSGTVTDLTVDGTVVSDYPCTGSIAGRLQEGGQITKCSSTVTVQGKETAGGIVGENRGGTVDLCSNHGNVSGSFNVGGITGENFGGIISRCSNSGEIFTSERSIGTYGTGGIAGRSVGGSSVITETYNKGKINSATEGTGGIAGYTNANGAIISNCYNTGDLIETDPEEGNKTSEAYIGGIIGIIGDNGVHLSNCYNIGEAFGADATGGVVGLYYDDDGIKPQKSIKNNFYVSSEFKYGIGKNLDSGGANIQNCASGISLGSLSSYAPRLSDKFMKDSSGLYGNGGNPVLRWQSPIGEEDKEYVEGVSIETQKRLDKYMQEHTDSIMAGQIIIDIFNTTNLLSESLFR